MAEYDQVELHGEQRAQALKGIAAQVAAWGLRLPDVEPLPLHFGLHEFDRIGETEFWIANEATTGYCGKFLFLFNGQTCPFHYHKVKHETFFVVKGTILMVTEKAWPSADHGEQQMHAGDRLVMLPGTGHSFTGIGPALVLEVSMPSVPKDSYFSDQRIGDNGVI